MKTRFLLVFLILHASFAFGQEATQENILKRFNSDYFNNMQVLKGALGATPQLNTFERDFILESSLLLSIQTSQNLTFCLEQYLEAYAIEKEQSAALGLAKTALGLGKRIKDVHSDYEKIARSFSSEALANLTKQYRYLILEKAYVLASPPQQLFTKYVQLINADPWYAELTGKQQAEIIYYSPKMDSEPFSVVKNLDQTDLEFAELDSRIKADLYLLYLTKSFPQGRLSLAGVLADYSGLKTVVREVFPHEEFVNNASFFKILRLAYELNLTEQKFSALVDNFKKTFEAFPVSFDTSIELVRASYMTGLQPKDFMISGEKLASVSPEFASEEVKDALLYSTLRNQHNVEYQISKMYNLRLQGHISSFLNSMMVLLEGNVFSQLNKGISGIAQLTLNLNGDAIEVSVTEMNPVPGEDLISMLAKLQSSELSQQSKNLEALGYSKLSIDIEFQETRGAGFSEQIATIREFTTGEKLKIRYEIPKLKR